jgi:hypothetical protein
MIARLALRRIFHRISKEGPPIAVIFTDGSPYENRPGEAPRVQILSRLVTPNSTRSCSSSKACLKATYRQIDLAGDQPIRTLAQMGHGIGLVPAAFWAKMLRNPLIALRRLRGSGARATPMAGNPEGRPDRLHGTIPPSLDNVPRRNCRGFSRLSQSLSHRFHQGAQYRLLSTRAQHRPRCGRPDRRKSAAGKLSVTADAGSNRSCGRPTPDILANA